MNKNKNKKSCVVKLTQEQQFQVLMAQLQERYNAWHLIRSRSTQFALWIVGMAIALSWKLIETPCANIPQRVAATILVTLLAIVSVYFLSGLATGLKHTRKALIRIEEALGTHEPSYYLQGEALLPNQYKSIKVRLSAHFLTLYALLTVTASYLLFAIWVPVHGTTRNPKDVLTTVAAKDAPQFQSESTTNQKGGTHD
jgi:hypothetical protein